MGAGGGGGGGGVRESVFLTSFQVLLMLLVQGPYFANHCSRAEDSCEALAANTQGIWERRSERHLLQVLPWRLPPKAHTRANGLAHKLRLGRLRFLDETF